MALGTQTSEQLKLLDMKSVSYIKDRICVHTHTHQACVGVITVFFRHGQEYSQSNAVCKDSQ